MFDKSTHFQEVCQLLLSLIVVIHVVQNCHTGEQRTQRDKINKRNYHDLNSLFRLSQCFRALQNGE